MTEYRKMYAMLCTAVSAAIDELENIPLAWSCRRCCKRRCCKRRSCT